MPRGRKPTGHRTLTGAERQARYRAARGRQPIQDPRATSLQAKRSQRADRRSRQQRWHDAVAELLAVQAECAAWLDKLPEATQGSATGEALQAIVELDLDELSAIEPPARLWPRLSQPMTAPSQSLHLLHWRLTRQPARDITTNDPLGDPPRPPSNRNGGRFQIGMGGRFQIGIPGRLRRNPHLLVKDTGRRQFGPPWQPVHARSRDLCRRCKPHKGYSWLARSKFSYYRRH